MPSKIPLSISVACLLTELLPLLGVIDYQYIATLSSCARATSRRGCRLLPLERPNGGNVGHRAALGVRAHRHQSRPAEAAGGGWPRCGPPAPPPPAGDGSLL